jgi:hypothetical protein
MFFVNSVIEHIGNQDFSDTDEFHLERREPIQFNMGFKSKELGSNMD